MVSSSRGAGGRFLIPLTIALTAAYLALLVLRDSFPSHRLLYCCLFMYTVILPGYLASLRLAPAMRAPMKALSTIVFGTAIAYAALFITALFRIRIDAFGIIAPVVVLVLAIWKGPRTDRDDGPGEDGRMNRRTAAVLVAIVVAVPLMILIAGDPVLYTSDSADHIGYIRAVSRTREAFPDQFYYRDGGILTHDIRKGMGQALWGAVNSLTGRDDVAAVWPVMSAVSAVFVLVALCCAGMLLFGSPGIGLTAAVLLVVFYDGGLRAYHLAMGAAGYTFGGAFYVAALALLPAAITRKTPGYATLAVLAAMTAAMTHIAHGAAWALVVAVILLSYCIQRRGKERIRRLRMGFIIAAAAILTLLPYLVFRYVRDFAPNNALHTHVQGVLHLTDKLYVLNPLLFLQVAGPLGALAAVSVVALWKRSRGDENLRIMLNGTIAVYTLVFCPLWYPLLHERMSYLVVRLEFTIPSMLVCAYLLREIWDKARRRNPEMSLGAAVLSLIAACVILGIPLAKTPETLAYRPGVRRAITEAGYHNLIDLFASIRNECPQGAVIASDPITSFGIPAFTDAYVICPYDQHSTPNDSTAITRIIDSRRLFSPWISNTEIRNVMAKYGAEYIVLNGRVPPGTETMYWTVNGGTTQALAARLHERTSPFRILYESDRVILARLVAGQTFVGTARTETRPPYVGDSLAADAALRLAPSGIPAIRIRTVQPARTEAARGDTIEFHITWVAVAPCPFARYVAHLRFDGDFPKGPLYLKAYGKPYRKAVERITNRRYRFRDDFQPLGGIVPPDTWPLFREVHDEAIVVVPRDIASGDYSISLKVTERTQYANYALKDLFTDDDLYSGAATGILKVK